MTGCASRIGRWEKMSQIVVRLADICNLECKMCDFVRSSDTYGQKMNIRDFERIVQKLGNARIHGSKVDLIRLDGNREGLLYPELAEAVSIVKRADMKTFLVTNGVKMDEAMSESLIRAGLDSVNFSVSGITEGTYADFQGYKRPRMQLKQVEDNIRKFVEINKDVGGKAFISVSMLLRSTDESTLACEYRKAVLLYKRIGVNSVLIGSEYPKPEGRELMGSSGCLSIPIVGVDGRVFPCCGGVESIALGNLFTDSVEKIFEGDEIYYLCKGLRKIGGCRLPEDCRWCVYNGLPERKTDFFDMRDFSELPQYDKGWDDFVECLHIKDKKIYIIGANNLAQELMEICKKHKIRIEAIVDNDYLKWGMGEYETPVISPREVMKHQIYVNCIKNQKIGYEIMKKYEGDSYLYAMFLEHFCKVHPVFSYSYLLN